MAVLVSLSISVGAVAFAGSGSADANDLRVASDQPVAGTGTITVRAAVDDGETAHFQVADTDGEVSEVTSVTDGGPDDAAAEAGVVETTFDLSALYSSAPATGTGTIYAGTGGKDSPATGSYDTKRSVTIDSSDPFVRVQSGATAEQGDQVKLTYTATDTPVPPKSVTLQVLDDSGDVYRTFAGVDPGEDQDTQFVLSNVSTGTYDLRIVVVDQVGHRSTDTYADGLVVTPGSGDENSVQEMEIVDPGRQETVDGNGALTVSASVSTAGETASFRLEDVDGTVSETKTVTDGGPRDENDMRGTVETTLDLTELYDTPPASGWGTLYAGGGFGFSVAEQGYETKTQLPIDSEPPGVTVSEGDAVKQGSTAVITYSVTSELQNVRSIELSFVGPDGTVYDTPAELQTGTDNGAQVEIPTDRPVGTYDVRVTAVDAAGYRATDTLDDGLTVTDYDGVAGDFEVESSDPVAGDGKVTVSNELSIAGENMTYAVMDADGTVSATRTVTNNGPADEDPTAGQVETTLDLSALFGERPATGTAKVYFATGERIDLPRQAFDGKKQFTIDATAPTADVVHGASGRHGEQVKLGYTATDDPQGLEKITITLVGPNGNEYAVPVDVQSGRHNDAQFEIPPSWPEGTYDVHITVIDEVGYRSSTTLTDGFVVER